MDCGQLGPLITYLKSVRVALQASVNFMRNAIDDAYDAALATDTYGGNYPAVPIEVDPLQTRMTYLGSLNPKPQAQIDKYAAIVQQLETLDGTQEALESTIAQIGSFSSQYTEQGCQPPL